MPAAEEQIREAKPLMKGCWSLSGQLALSSLIEILLREEELADSLEKEADDVNEQEEREI